MTTRNRRFRLTIISLIMAAGGVLACTTRAQSTGTGEKNYKKNCTPCHGVNGDANTPAGKVLKARDFHSPEIQKASDEELAAVIAKGKNNMPSFEKQLKPNEIMDLVKYIRTFSKK